MFGLFSKYKLMKVRRYQPSKKYGIAARTLKELIKKSCHQLEVSDAGAHVCLYVDGTEVTEEYFSSLPDNTELVLLSREQKWSGVVYDIGQLLHSDRNADRLIEAAKELRTDESSPKRRKILTDLLLSLEDTSEHESREQDQEWFKGVDVRFKTKSSYMNFNCASRIRGYMKEVSDYAKSMQTSTVRAQLMKMANSLSDMLKLAHYNGCYFDRSEKETNRLCTQEGWFTCQGPFDQDLCLSLHSLNPYSNHESRIIFSTWNMDHRIEKKRTILPALLQAAQSHKCADINLHYFFRLLFTRQNLKLVHIACHRKGAHNLQCDQKKIYKRVKCTTESKQTKEKRLRLT